MSGLGIGFAMAGTWLGKAAAIIPEKARLALILIAVAGACFFLGRCSGERAERARIEAANARATVEGINRADEQDQAIREAAQNRADAVEGAIRNAVTNHPEEAARPVGPASAGALDELRRRQGR